MAPLFPSWLGNGTSAFALFVIVGAPGPGTARTGFSVCGSGEVGLEDEYDIQAVCSLQYGTIAVRGLTAGVCWSDNRHESGIPRSTVERTVDNIIEVIRPKWGAGNKKKRKRSVERERCSGRADIAKVAISRSVEVGP